MASDVPKPDVSRAAHLRDTDVQQSRSAAHSTAYYGHSAVSEMSSKHLQIVRGGSGGPHSSSAETRTSTFSE